MTIHAAPVQRAGVREWIALAVLMIPVLLVSVDNTVLSFALPSISADLQPTGNQLLWIVDIYALMLAGLLIAMGSVGDRFGRRRLLMIGSLGFGAASLFSSLATSAEHLILGRAMLGFFGAMLMPSTLSLIRNIFVVDRDRRVAIATWAAMFSGGAALGPVLGGWLLEHFAWGSVFLMNVPLIALFVPLGMLLLPESRDPHPGPVDPASIALSMATLAPLVYAIKHGAKYGIDPVTVTATSVGLIAGVLFVRRQLNRTNPMLDVTLFANRVFSGAVIANLLSLMSLAGFLFFGAQLLQLVIGLSPMDSAMVLIPGLIVTVAGGFMAVRLVERFSFRGLITASFIASSTGYALAALIGDPTVMSIMAAFAIMGIGIGVAETLTNDLILSSVPPHKAGAASAISETAYEIGAVLGTAVLGGVVMAAYRSNLQVPEYLQMTADNGAFETIGGTMQLAEVSSDWWSEPLRESAMKAFELGVQQASTVAIVAALGAAVVTWITLRGR